MPPGPARRRVRARPPAGARNPRANPAARREVLEVVRGLADRLDPQGRSAVVLAGSWARGDAHEGSDVDLWVIGSREGEVVLERGGRHVSLHYATVAGERRRMRAPAHIGGVVPGWRSAMILRDPNGAAATLRSEARDFRWSSVRRACSDYIARQLVGWSEEVMKLLRALETGESETASVQRNLLANRMAFLRSVELEYLWGTENGLWERVAARAGPAFRSAQRAALGTEGESWRESCEAALRLYSLTARANLGVLRGERRRLVVEACRRAGYPIERVRVGRR
ncbi:MAG TPA: nucleotidyltransferase domain-containing protein [Thermoplasmata archaeon]|nr:nucleotidyltransferase domain-containing protein [Thermoplasmata archaeon]